VISINAYYKHFQSLYGVVTAAVAAMPLISLSPILPSDWDSWIYPPLGDSSFMFKFITTVFIILAPILVFFTKSSKYVLNPEMHPRLFITLGTIALFFLVTYSILYLRVVNVVKDKSEGPQAVSVGFCLNDTIEKSNPNTSDLTLLQQTYGADEETITKLWTPGSLFAARLLLFASCTFFYILAIAIGSLAVLIDLLNKGTKLVT